MFGFWRVVKFLDDMDNAGASRSVDVESTMNADIKGELYLPPYLRQNQCEIKPGSVVLGLLHDVVGKGAAFCGIGDADWGYFIDADINIKQNLIVENNINSKTGDITAENGDINADMGDVTAAKMISGVKKGTVSLQKHKHSITPQTGTITSSADGTIPPDTPPAP